MRTHATSGESYIQLTNLTVIRGSCAKCRKFFCWIGSLGRHIGTHTKLRELYSNENSYKSGGELYSQRAEFGLLGADVLSVVNSFAG